MDRKNMSPDVRANTSASQDHEIEPPDEVFVRPATREDAAVIANLVVALADYEKLAPPDSDAQNRLMEDAFGPNPRVEIVLAQVQEEVVGYAFFFETYSTFLALPTLYLEDLFVLPDFRGRKVGFALFAHCASEAVRRGCGRMEWAVLDWNTTAIGFYERLGARHLHDWQLYRIDGNALAAFGDHPD
jgi:GNAT superfamily N-acetyltransferase